MDLAKVICSFADSLYSLHNVLVTWSYRRFEGWSICRESTPKAPVHKAITIFRPFSFNGSYRSRTLHRMLQPLVFETLHQMDLFCFGCELRSFFREFSLPVASNCCGPLHEGGGLRFSTITLKLGMAENRVRSQYFRCTNEVGGNELSSTPNLLKQDFVASYLGLPQ